MAFRNSVAAPSTAASGAKSDARQPGGKYAGIKPARAQNPKFEPGEYIIEFVRTYKSRTEGTFMFDAKVIARLSSVGTRVEDVALGLINIAGKSYDIGMPLLVSLTMALCGCTTQDQLNREEPDWDYLVDALCDDERGTSSDYGSNPAQGKRVHMRCWHSQNTDKQGNHYQNFEFRAAPEAA